MKKGGIKIPRELFSAVKRVIVIIFAGEKVVKREHGADRGGRGGRENAMEEDRRLSVGPSLTHFGARRVKAERFKFGAGTHRVLNSNLVRVKLTKG